jgi:hypothetical protein
MNRYPVKTLIVGGCAAALVTSAFLAQSRPSGATQLRPSSVAAGIRVMTVNGSGCPGGTARTYALPGQDGFRATYTKFRAVTGQGNVLNFRKNCQFSVRMQPPPGYAYTAVSAQYRGSARLAKGMRGMQQTSYYLPGQPRTVTQSHPLSGPLNGRWNHNEHVMLSALGHQPCGQAVLLNINAQLITYPGRAASGPVNYLSLNSADHGSTIYRFTRAACHRIG